MPMNSGGHVIKYTHWHYRFLDYSEFQGKQTWQESGVKGKMISALILLNGRPGLMHHSSYHSSDVLMFENADCISLFAPQYVSFCIPCLKK